MEKKINVAEILKDCPKGMPLDCTMFDDVKFIGIEDDEKPISIRAGDNIYPYLTKFGTYTFDENAKCVIFPKGKTTWEGFVPPCKFKDGDILSNGICICNGNENDEHYGCYVGVGHIEFPDYFINRSQNRYFTKENSRLATEEERERLFHAIKANGYKWNAETKTLEKLIEPRFNVGDRIKNINSGICNKVIKILEDCYLVESNLIGQATIGFDIQDNWELVPNKFDINALKPFDKVLVRDRGQRAFIRHNRWL